MGVLEIIMLPRGRIVGIARGQWTGCREIVFYIASLGMTAYSGTEFNTGAIDGFGVIQLVSSLVFGVVASTLGSF